MRKLLLTSAAMAALAFGSVSANAQGSGSAGGGSAGGGAVPPAASSGGGSAGGAMGGGSGAQSEGGMPRGAEAPASSSDAAPRETSPSAERTSDSGAKAGETARGENGENRNAAGEHGSHSADKAEKGGEMKSGRAAAPKELSSEQNTNIRKNISTTNVQKTEINFNVSVGTAIPRTVHLQPLPATIIEVVPEYRDYSYIVLADGRIVIIEPSTYEIVTIISG
ncbi:DUF1236 domain-containing protein [Terrihabitans sp. B22-R8]|uniref:DUF1236 domain-containing protein n=1 Tax=Terrihabitans sp. B22-R8 TaxID=3425128 RepID=UPI00403C80CC